MRPQLKPALYRAWRGESTLQLGVDPERAVVISGLDPARTRLLDSLDGSHDMASLLALADRLGIDREEVARLLELLHGCDLLHDAAGSGGSVASLSQQERDRFAPDLASLSLTHGGMKGPFAVFARRRAASVVVYGAGRIGGAIAALLGAAGIGRVDIEDAEPTRPADVSPAGLAPDAVGTSRGRAATERVRQISPSTEAGVRGPQRPDGAVLSPVGPAPPGLADRLVRDGVPHLWVGIRETLGVVGPLVIPGRTSCRRCHDLHRADRDPGWAGVAAQLLARPRGVVEPCDAVVATAVAAIATMQLLALLDGGEPPPAVDGTLELRAPMGALRRRSWTAHPACGCQWANTG